MIKIIFALNNSNSNCIANYLIAIVSKIFKLMKHVT